MSDRTFAPQEEWERLAPSAVASSELREGASRVSGEFTLYRLRAVVDGQEETLELLWVSRTQRAAVASPRGVLWTNAPSPEAALERWASGTARGQRTRPR